jgi:hypothetical protein
LFDSYVLLADDHVNNVSYFPFMSIKTVIPYFCVLSEGYYVIIWLIVEKQQIQICIVSFDPTLLEPTIYHCRGQHANHKIPDDVWKKHGKLSRTTNIFFFRLSTFPWREQLHFDEIMKHDDDDDDLYFAPDHHLSGRSLARAGSGQTRLCKFVFAASPLTRTIKVQEQRQNWLARNQDMSEQNDLFQWASPLKIKLGVVFLYKADVFIIIIIIISSKCDLFTRW